MKTILITIIGIAFFALIGTVGAFECNNLDFAPFAIRSAISLCVMLPCAYALHRLED